jgi:hypothetical protein
VKFPAASFRNLPASGLGSCLGGLFRLLDELLGVLMRIPRMLQSLLAEFMGSQMIRLRVSGGSSAVGVFCQVVKLCGSIVRTL